MNCNYFLRIGLKIRNTASCGITLFKEDDFRPIGRVAHGGYGAYNAYISAATRYAALGAPTLYDHHPSPIYGSKALFSYYKWIFLCSYLKLRVFSLLL